MTPNLKSVSHEHHERLMQHVDEMPAVGKMLLAAPMDELRPRLAELDGWLTGLLIPHLEAAEATLYPELERMLQNRHSMAPMRREHEEIRRQVAELSRLVAGLGDRATTHRQGGGPSPRPVPALRAPRDPPRRGGGLHPDHQPRRLRRGRRGDGGGAEAPGDPGGLTCPRPRRRAGRCPAAGAPGPPPSRAGAPRGGYSPEADECLAQTGDHGRRGDRRGGHGRAGLRSRRRRRPAPSRVGAARWPPSLDGAVRAGRARHHRRSRLRHHGRAGGDGDHQRHRGRRPGVPDPPRPRGVRSRDVGVVE